MDEALRKIVETHESARSIFKKDLEDATVEEIKWQPLPEAIPINLPRRHLLSPSLSPFSPNTEKVFGEG